MVGKQKKRPRSKKHASRSSSATRYMQRLFVDCSGAQKVDSISGKRMYMLIVDDFTRFTWVCFLKSTSDCSAVLDSFLKKATTLTDGAGVEHIHFIRSDGGPDFHSTDTENVLDKYSITHEFINAGASNQNGVVERRIGIVAERVRASLAWSNLPHAWWAECVRHTVQTLNLTPSTALPDCVSPYFMRTGKHHPTQLLHPFGCLASVYVKPGDRECGKLDKAGKVGIFLGYDERSDGGVQGYRVYNWQTNKTTNRYDVDFNSDLPAMNFIADIAANSVQMQFLNREVKKFFESTGKFHTGYVKKTHIGKHNEKLFEIHYDDGDIEDMNFQELIQHLVTSTSEVVRRIAQQYPRLRRDDPRATGYHEPEGRAHKQHFPSTTREQEGHDSLRRSNRKRKRSDRLNVSTLGDVTSTATQSSSTYGKASRRAVLQAKLFGVDQSNLVPEIELDFANTQAHTIPKEKSFKQAMRGPYRRYWLEAARTELDNMRAKGVYELVRLEPGERIRPIRGKWVLKVKKNEDGSIDKFRARYVALGNTQRPGLDYRKTTAPVLNAVSLRCMLAIATEMDWPLVQLDVSVAYMNSFLEKDIRLFLAPPPGLHVPPGFGCLARKGLYGLCQSGHLWAKLKADTLKQLGFQRSRAEPCLWTRHNEHGFVMAGVVVDDFIICGSSIEACHAFRDELMAAWDCTYLGDLEWCLNLRVRRDRRRKTMTIDQSQFIQELAQRFNLQHAAPVSTPADPSVHLSTSMGPADNNEKREMQRRPYQQAVGAVLYTRLTRVDCIAAIAEVARFMANPGLQHWAAVKRIIKYLNGTKTWGLCYRSSNRPKGSPWVLTLYVDSGLAMDPDKRRSRYGYIILLNANPIAFGTGLTQKTATSTPVAEYIAMAHGLKELLWTYQILKTIGLDVATPMRVLEDNQACIHIADNPVSQKRTRQMDIRYHFIRDYIEDGTITVQYCPTKDMLADILTKAMPRSTFQRLRTRIIGDVLSFLGSDELLVSAHYCRTIYQNLAS